MRSAEEIQKLIIEIAKSDDRVRAILLNGSRANNKVLPDKHQDFDIVYIVVNLGSFTSDHSWTNVFGDKIIWQIPCEMSIGEEDNERKSGFSYLMLFKDGNRIDLTLFPKERLEKDFHLDSLTLIWLDKDNLFSNISKPTEFDYLIKEPTEKEFLDTCKEFWWVSTYVSKGLLRKEITYSKEMLETAVQQMFMKMIEWFIGTETNFSISFGKGGKFMKQNLSSTQYDKILATYSDQQLENNWKALFLMTDLFKEFAAIVANKLNFQYNSDEEENVITFLKASYNGQNK